MSKEILFKAKRKNWRELPKEYWWVEGDYITDEKDESKAYIGYLFGVENGAVEDCDIAEIDPETLCQYTGVNDGTKWEQLSDTERGKFLTEWNIEKDRQNRKEDWNGRKIWENDICEMVDNGIVHTYVIVWDKDELDFKGTNGQENYGRNYQYLGCCEEIVRIGNIFDTPELLKED